MFTGLVQELGEVSSLRRATKGAVLTLRARALGPDAKPGDSIAINGACLTVTSQAGAELGFDLSEETLSSTTLGALRPGDGVNLEPSLRPDSKLGGHFVTGHVDGVGTIKSRATEGEYIRFEVLAPPEVQNFLVPKGSVALDGVSLTVVEVLRDSFTLVIIPHTADVTTFGRLAPGGKVNLEADILGKYVMKFISNMKSGEDGLMKKLADGGFIS